MRREFKPINGSACTIMWRELEERWLLAPKIIFFAVGLAFYAVYLYRAKYVTDVLQMTDEQYGDLSGIMAIMGTFGGTLWAGLADRLKRYKLLLAVLCILLALSFETARWVVEPLVGTEKYALKVTSANVVLAFNAFFLGGLFPLSDYAALKILTTHGGENVCRDLYSRQVLFGTLGYGFVSWVGGKLIKFFTISVLYHLQTICSVLAAVAVMIFAPRDTPGSAAETCFSLKDRKEDSKEKEFNTKELSLLKLLSQGNFLFMLCVVFLIGSARSVMTTFLGKYWEQAMHLNTEETSLAANAGIVLEIVIFIMGPFLLRILGVHWMLLLAQLAMVLRAWAYVFLPTNAKHELVYAVELLKGLAFGFTQISGTKVVCDNAPPGLLTTAQGLYTTFYAGLPLIFTSFAGGRCYQHFGPATLFLFTAGAASAALVLCLLKYIWDGNIVLVNKKTHSRSV